MEVYTSPAIELLGLSKTCHIGGLAVSDGTTAVIRRVNLAILMTDNSSLNLMKRNKHD